MALQVQPVAQPQRLEFLVAKLAGQKPPGLVAKLRDPLLDDRLIEVVIPIHVPNYGVPARGGQIPCG